ncbi:MAG: AMP-binding protein [Alphaproteobacteria bacterium]|nr:AMP-binding protein [Alphaproteobacteria bacterium]
MTAAALIEARTGLVCSAPELESLTEEFQALFGPPDAKQLILILTVNRAAIVAAWRAALRAGHAVLPCDYSMPPEALRNLINIYRPSWLILPEDHAETVPETYRKKGDFPGVWLFRREGAETEIHPDLAVLLTTSGSTGSPKLVRLSHKNIEANTAGIIQVLGITAEDRAAAHMSLAYSFGMSVINTHLAAGASLVLFEDSLTESAFWKAMRAHEVTSFAGVPYHYGLIHRLGLERLKIPAVRAMTQAGGRLDPQLVSHFSAAAEKRGGKFFVMYGQTEAAPRITTMPAHRVSAKPASAGLPMPQGKIVIEDGEVVYHGPNVMMGYAESAADLARGDEMRGRLATGDLGYLDEEGCLFITGRKKRFAKIDGLRVSLDEVENIAGAIAPAAAVEYNEQIVLFTAGSPEAVRQHVVAHVGVHASRVQCREVGAFPRLSNDKIDRESLLRLLS